MANNMLITIITPTYNRAKEIRNLAKSLYAQIDQDFQWLIVDDGSTDNTEHEIQKLPVSNFMIDYHKKENGGKHTALNYSHHYIKGSYVCIVDSDDILTPNAISEIKKAIRKYKDDTRIGCISFQRGSNAKKPLSVFPKGETISNHINFRINDNRRGDCFEVIKADVFKSITFPKHHKEKFMSEGYLWANIAKKYDTVYISKVLYICTYLDGGLTKTGRKLRIDCPLGGMDNSNAYLEKNKRANLKLRYKIKHGILFDCYSLFANYTMEKSISRCKNTLLAISCYPLGLALYVYWKNKYKTGSKQ